MITKVLYPIIFDLGFQNFTNTEISEKRYLGTLTWDIQKLFSYDPWKYDFQKIAIFRDFKIL